MLEERPDLDDFLLLPDSPGLPYWFTDAVLGVGLLFFAMLTILLLLRNRNLDLKRRVAAQSAQEIQYHREELLLRLKLQKVLIRDIHDGLGSLTTNLSFASVLARNEKEITKKNEWLEKIERLVSEANMEVRDLMNTLEENSTRWPDLIETIRRSSEAILDYKSTTVRFHIAGVPVEEDIGLAEGLSLVRIVREGMNNIVKYSGASLVEIGMESSVDNVRITIKDNGCGFDPETVRRGRGLNNLAARTAELGGRFEIISGNGTQLEFIFPRPIRIDKQEMSAVSAGNPVSEVKQLAIRAAKGVSNEFNHS
jgi:signal transduction histidine kinase